MISTPFKILFIALLSLSHDLAAQVVVSDPLAQGHEKGRTYMKWLVDVNNDGINDVLLSEKLTNEEAQTDPFPNVLGFGVYLGQKDGKYLNSQYLDTPGGREVGGMDVDVSQCYVGYIDEVKQYGVVTVLSKYSRKQDFHDAQVVCYTVKGDHMKETNLGGIMPDPDKHNAVYNKYLAPDKRTHVVMQAVIPNP